MPLQARENLHSCLDTIIRVVGYRMVSYHFGEGHSDQPGALYFTFGLSQAGCHLEKLWCQ